jgi:hypothetical protein
VAAHEHIGRHRATEPDVTMTAFSTPADEELCRQISRRVVNRHVTGLVAIVSLHRSERTKDHKRCGLCRETWPCRTVMLAVSAHQETHR